MSSTEYWVYGIEATLVVAMWIVLYHDLKMFKARMREMETYCDNIADPEEKMAALLKNLWWLEHSEELKLRRKFMGSIRWEFYQWLDK